MYRLCGHGSSCPSLIWGLPLDMTADEKTQRDAGSTRSDRIGKVFAVLSKGMRLCLICEGAFTWQASREHAKVSCRPAVPQESGYSPQYPTCQGYVLQA